MFCVVCGVEKEEELRDGVCASCFLEKHPLAQVGTHVDVEVCVHCHDRKRGEIWLPGHGTIEPVVEEGVREAVQWDKFVSQPRMTVSVVAEDERNFGITIEARGLADGLPFTKLLTTRSRLKNGTCVRCSRIQGGYYESIVQVRAANRDLTKDEKRTVRALASRFIERIVEQGDRHAFVLRDLEEHGGLDIYMGTTNSGRMLTKQLLNEFGGRVSEHAKTIGQKDGLDIIRLTFALRFPEYRAGDLVSLQDELYEVTGMGAKNATLSDLRTGRIRHVPHGDLDRGRVVSRDESREAVVVSQTEAELQLLDPWNYNTVSVLRPPTLGAVGESVDVLRHEEELVPVRRRSE